MRHEKLAKKKEKKLPWFIGYFFGTLIGVLGAVQADLSLETRIGNSRGEEKCIVFELGLRRLALRCQIFPKLAQEGLLLGYSKSRRYDK